MLADLAVKVPNWKRSCQDGCQAQSSSHRRCGVKAAFEQELKKRRLLAEEERQELLGRIEDVRSDMTNKIIAQQESMELKNQLTLINKMPPLSNQKKNAGKHGQN
ncbi:hypothetical protein QTG54_012681 [Skeletonema marinoi]|uniref:Uncharacterized protein n=1 Tax=Skeletonema marinoi TaxID=267567 RepID=A0AAD8XZ86_9STRA|nr:hypothetical protein QTG54_012681 [Skeletonema marinoi]